MSRSPFKSYFEREKHNPDFITQVLSAACFNKPFNISSPRVKCLKLCTGFLDTDPHTYLTANVFYNMFITEAASCDGKLPHFLQELVSFQYWQPYYEAYENELQVENNGDAKTFLMNSSAGKKRTVVRCLVL